jgi:hypothetical protein
MILENNTASPPPLEDDILCRDYAEADRSFDECRVWICKAMAWEEETALKLSRETERCDHTQLQVELKQKEVDMLNALLAGEEAALAAADSARKEDKEEREATEAVIAQLKQDMEKAREDWKRRESSLLQKLHKAEEAGDLQCEQQTATFNTRLSEKDEDMKRIRQEGEKREAGLQFTVSELQAKLATARNRLQQEARPEMAHELQTFRQQLTRAQSELNAAKKEIEALHRSNRGQEEEMRALVNSNLDLQQKVNELSRRRKEDRRGEGNRDRKSSHRESDKERSRERGSKTYSDGRSEEHKKRKKDH